MLGFLLSILEERPFSAQSHLAKKQESVEIGNH
jgi:hypothetical protein